MVQATANFAAFVDGDSYRGRENPDTPSGGNNGILIQIRSRGECSVPFNDTVEIGVKTYLVFVLPSGDQDSQQQRLLVFVAPLRRVRAIAALAGRLLK